MINVDNSPVGPDNRTGSPPREERIRRDLFVIGGSAGAVEAVSRLVSCLPRDFPGSVLVVIHFPPTAISVLPRILARAGKLPVEHAADGAKIKPGTIYVAPPDMHLRVKDQRMELAHGPRENGFRPAIDPLFRSAASAYRSRAAGVLLSGTMDDGVAGLLELHWAGGVTIVQSPEEAMFPVLPLNAIERAPIDASLPVKSIAQMMVNLAGLPQAPNGEPKMSEQEEKENRAVLEDFHRFENGGHTETDRTVITCPECGGLMWEKRAGGMVHYHCHVGHVYSEETVFSEQGRTLEAALWAAVRALEERAALARRLLARARESQRAHVEMHYAQIAQKAEEAAGIIRRTLLSNADRAAVEDSREE